MSRFGDILTRYGLARWMGALTPYPALDWESIPTGATRLVIYNPAGTYQGVIYTATALTWTRTLDQIGSLAFSVPATDPTSKYLLEGYHIQARHYILGDLGEFILRTRHLSVNQATWQCDAWSLLMELAQANTFLRRKYSDVAVGTVISAMPVPTEKILNPGFETSGSGGNTFANWTDDLWGSNGESVSDETVNVFNGNHAAKLTSGVGALEFATLYQLLSVVPGQSMVLSFWTHGDGTWAPEYRVYDATHSVAIVSRKTTGVTGTAYTLVSQTFTVPAGCTSIEVRLFSPPANSAVGYFDDVSCGVVSNLYGLLYGTGWTQGAFDSGMGNVVVEFNGQSVLEAIVEIVKRKKKHFREGTTARTLDVGALGADSGNRLIAPTLMTSDLELNTVAGIIETIDETCDGDGIVNSIIPLGGGQGNSQLTLEKATRTTPYTIQTTTNPDGSTCWYLQDAASVAAHGARWKVYPIVIINPLSNSDADITNAANSLYDASVTYLQRFKDEKVDYSVSAYRVPVGLRPGDLVRLVYRGVVTRQGRAFKWVDLNDLFWVMQRVDQMEDGAVKTKLVISNIDRQKMNDTHLIIGALQRVQVLETFVQPYPSAETFVYKEEIANGHAVTLPVEIDSRVLYLNSTKVRVQTRSLRSTVTAAAAGGGTTVSSESGGGSTVTSASGGGATVTSGNGTDHQHRVYVTNGSSSYPMYFDGAQALGSRIRANGASGYDYTDVETGPHTHSVTISNHTHSVTISNHTHSVTLSNHTHGMTYGIYDDTVYPATISLSIDGVDRTSALGGPWAAGGGALSVELDITTYLVNAAGGLRQNHTLVFSCASGQGQIVATIRSLMTTQAITVA